MLNLKDPSLLRQQCYINGEWLDADSGQVGLQHLCANARVGVGRAAARAGPDRQLQAFCMSGLGQQLVGCMTEVAERVGEIMLRVRHGVYLARLGPLRPRDRAGEAMTSPRGRPAAVTVSQTPGAGLTMGVIVALVGTSSIG